MAATPDEIAQQTRFITEVQTTVRQFMQYANAFQSLAAVYGFLSLSDPAVLDDAALAAAHTTRAKFAAAVQSIGAVNSLLASNGNGANLEKFSR